MLEIEIDFIIPNFFFVLLDEHGPWGLGLRFRFCKRIRSRVFKIMIFCDVGEGRGLMF